MTNSDLTSSFMQAILKAQVSFRQAIQYNLKKQGTGMTFEMLQIMARLWRQEGVNQQDLADKTFKDKASLTYLINKLSEKGWVIRSEDTEDRRNKRIYLTAEGKKMKDLVMPLLDDIYRVTGENVEREHLQIGINYLQELNNAFKKYQISNIPVAFPGGQCPAGYTGTGCG